MTPSSPRRPWWLAAALAAVVSLTAAAGLLATWLDRPADTVGTGTAALATAPSATRSSSSASPGRTATKYRERLDASAMSASVRSAARAM